MYKYTYAYIYIYIVLNQSIICICIYVYTYADALDIHTNQYMSCGSHGCICKRRCAYVEYYVSIIPSYTEAVLTVGCRIFVWVLWVVFNKYIHFSHLIEIHTVPEELAEQVLRTDVNCHVAGQHAVHQPISFAGHPYWSSFAQKSTPSSGCTVQQSDNVTDIIEAILKAIFDE